MWRSTAASLPAAQQVTTWTPALLVCSYQQSVGSTCSYQQSVGRHHTCWQYL